MKSMFERWFQKRPKRKTIEGQEIDLAPEGSDKNICLFDANYVRCRFKNTTNRPYYLGNAHFEDCYFELRGTGQNIFCADALFANCTFKFVKARKFILKDGQRFHNCIFKGRLNDSAISINPNGEHSRGVVSNCDFRNLKFDLLEFRGEGQLDNLKFPDWPIVSLRENNQMYDSFDKGQLPNEIARWLNPTLRPVVLLIDLSQHLDDPEEFWAVAHDAPFLDFNNKNEKPLPDTTAGEALKHINCRTNAIIEKYQSAVRILVRPQNYISGVTKSENDLVLHIVDKGDDSRVFDVLLKDCTLAEFRGGPFDGTLPSFEKSFFLNGYEINHEEDVVEIKGARKAMGRLCLSFREALRHPE